MRTVAFENWFPEHIESINTRRWSQCHLRQHLQEHNVVERGFRCSGT